MERFALKDPLKQKQIVTNQCEQLSITTKLITPTETAHPSKRYNLQCMGGNRQHTTFRKKHLTLRASELSGHFTALHMLSGPPELAYSKPERSANSLFAT